MLSVYTRIAGALLVNIVYGTSSTSYAWNSELNAPDTPHPASAEDSRSASLFIHLGIGKEWLRSRGGVSEFRGHANIGGTTAGMRWRITERGHLYSEVVAHNFTTQTKEDDLTMKDTTTSQDRFLRVSSHISFIYNFSPKPDHYRFAAGSGLYRATLPILELVDPSTGETELANRSAVGASAIVEYARFLHEHHQISTLLMYVPTLRGKVQEGRSSSVFIDWRYEFARGLQTEIGLASHQDFISIDIACPNVDSCDERSTSSSAVVRGRFGLSYNF